MDKKLVVLSVLNMINFNINLNYLVKNKLNVI
ncbi:hypothetical protein J2786_003670 [Chryseobacterium vietnamense]|uniref:Uncharacterized protein n=1 Tax=Chryseobacterium vietnamense TaxID=866785 RepID=A0ACC6JBU2_9FLAO|nr:hypothetical protein [Chryseobacterium vietnamense]